MTIDQLSELRAWFSNKLCEITQSTDAAVAWDDELSDFGLSSSQVVGLTGELERWLGTQLPANLFYDHATLRKVAEYILAGGQAAQPASQPAPVAALNEPIAIVGMACRFPGANNPEEFWELLRSGTDAVSEVPMSRWDIEAFFDPTPGMPGKMNTRHGGFIADIERFDADAFGV